MIFSHRNNWLLAAGLTAFAVPAAAQDICGGSGQWIGGTEGGSDISTSDNYREQMALVLSGNEYVSLFTLSAPTLVRIEAAGRGNGDPLIDVLDADGNVLLSDDDSGGNGNARAEVDLDPGTYCMSLVSYDGSPMTAFVRIGRDEHEALTEGAAETETVADTPQPSETVEVTPETGPMSTSCSDAAPMGTLDSTLTATGSAQQSPYLSFTLTNPMAVSVTASNEDADPVITLYDSDEEYLSENDDFDGLNSRIDYANTLPAGTYCINIEALNDETLPIEVTVSEYDPIAALQGLYERGEAAPPLDGSYPVTMLGALSNRMRQDVNATDTATWYAVDVDQGGLLLVEAIAAGPNGDPWLVLYDDLGRELAINDDHGDSYDSLVTARVSPGTYLIGVRQVSDDTQGFIRMVFERYVPAP